MTPRCRKGKLRLLAPTRRAHSSAGREDREVMLTRPGPSSPPRTLRGPHEVRPPVLPAGRGSSFAPRSPNFRLHTHTVQTGRRNERGPWGSFSPRSQEPSPCPEPLRRLLRREASGATASREVHLVPAGWPPCPQGTGAVPNPGAGGAHTAGAQAPGAGQWPCHCGVVVVLATRAPPRRFSPTLSEPQVVGFTTTSTYQEAREPEEWKAMLADLIQRQTVVNDGRTF